ncbi:MAG: VacJ family lipoprotein [Alphaproteobacteria bacterium]|jgi:phospholipid-binding lipoprotein MlaA|nr:VacJ family lipoprotein [Candidatus Jidaibacter sp.]
MNKFSQLLFICALCLCITYSDTLSFAATANKALLTKETKPSDENPYDLSNLEDDDTDSIYLSGVDVINYPDEFEPFNRAMFKLNKGLDTAIFNPIAIGYEEVVPEKARHRVTSFLSNLHEPVYFLNHVLQGEPDLAAQNLGRFLVNTMFGLAGLFDVCSDDLNMGERKTDFGLTLKKYGVGHGPYLVMPILGPTSGRDLPGWAVDIVADPFNSYKFDKGFKIARSATEFVNTKQRYRKLLAQLAQTSLDEYATLRSIYLQKR